MATLTSLKTAYTGGEGRDWARKSGTDTALCLDLSAEAALYDNDSNPKNLNKKYVNWKQDLPGAVSDGQLVGSIPGFIPSSEISFMWDVSVSSVSPRIQHRKTALSKNDDPAVIACNAPNRHLSPDAKWELSEKLLSLNINYSPATAVTCQWMPS